VPRIINIAGTNGSGKSTVVRWLLDQALEKTPVMQEGRSIPIGYDLVLPKIETVVHVMGAYEVPTGGCDTIKDVRIAFDHLVSQVKEGKHIVYEGAFVMNMQRGPEMVQQLAEHRVYVLLLTTPLAACFQAIAARRAENGEGVFVQRKNIEGHHVRAQNYSSKMRQAGATVKRVTREEAPKVLWEILSA
jgi:hypothetical protein